MISILETITPIFLIIGVGYLAVRLMIISPAEIAGLGRFVLYFTLPALIIIALGDHPIDETLNWDYLTVYGCGTFATFFIAIFVARFLFGKSLADSSIIGMGTCVSNSAYIGYPIIVSVIGPVAAICIALNFVVDNLMLIPLSLILADLGGSGESNLPSLIRQILIRLAKNPIIIGIVLGLAFALSGITLPAPVDKAMRSLAAVSGPTALFVIGGTLVGQRIAGQRLVLSQVVSFKLILHPLMVALFVMLVGSDLSATFAVGAILSASAPMMSVYPIFADPYRLGGMGAASVFVATLMAFITISIAIAIVTHVFPLV